MAEAGIRETIRHGETGLLSERDPEDHGHAIDAILMDADLRMHLGVAGRQTVVEHWTWDQSYQQLERNIERALSAPQGRGHPLTSSK